MMLNNFVTKNAAFERAVDVFLNTLDSPHNRGKKDISEGMIKLVDEATIVQASGELVNELSLGRRVWMTSDLHFDHENIISYCGRPHRNVGDMNADLRKLLSKVGEDDWIVFVGDLVMGQMAPTNDALEGLPGKKILVVGNHDFTYSGKPRFAQMVESDGTPTFRYVVPFLFWQDLAGSMRDVIVTHYPVEAPDDWRHGQIRNYHGHLHDTLLESTDRVKYINVGWDVNLGLNCL